jgi:hypoxanthine phosphoribosyltransferase
MIDANNIIDYSYDDFCNGINIIAKKIQNSDFKPDYIVGIVRGGSIPAVYLSHKLKIPVQMIHWSTRDVTDWGNESNIWIPEDINDGKKVLIVDDIVDGGETIKTLLEDWRNSLFDDTLQVDNIRISAMVYNTSQDVKVDFYDRTIDRTIDYRWVHFPWE